MKYLPIRDAAADVRFDRFVRILQARGVAVNEQTKLLDFGCGSGHLVKAALARGVDAYGSDVDFDHPSYDQTILDEFKAQDRVRSIEVERRSKAAPRVIGLSPSSSDYYRIPFDDDTFDVVISDMVLEHVGNYDEMVRELHRVLKPGGSFLHFFPPPLSLLEGHTKIPFGAAFHPDWYLKLLSHAGVRMWHQKGKSAQESFQWTRDYLNSDRINYLSKADVIRAFQSSFDVAFVESELFKIHPKARVFLHPALYRNFQGRILFGTRKT